jgi:hypothetical protein
MRVACTGRFRLAHMAHMAHMALTRGGTPATERGYVPLSGRARLERALSVQ